jgi:hypothetical protein
LLDLSSLPEVFVSSRAIASDVSRAVQRGLIRRLASRVYTGNLREPPEKLIRRNLWPIVDSILPGALIADRTALEHQPAPDGSVFLIAAHKRDLRLPGIILRPRKGPPALDTDRPFVGSLRLSSMARALLENMRPSRARGGAARTLPISEIETRLEEILRVSGVAKLQRLRDEARTVAESLNLPNEFLRLDACIGAMLGTRTAALSSPIAIARAAGLPYDPQRLDLFQKLFAALQSTAPVQRRSQHQDGPAISFFEAYFSNFIEGTEFAVNEAAAIIFDAEIPSNRPQDAHDVFGTWKVVSNPRDMSQLPHTSSDLITLLQRRHAQVMQARPEQQPGRFKLEANRAGGTQFVAPDLVIGTLNTGFELYRALNVPLHRAIFMMFLIAEVHPFVDGNGRIARIMMNAELVAANECRILIPTIFRNNYLSALKALSLNGISSPLIRALEFAQRYTAAINFSSLEQAQAELTQSHAFVDPNEAEVKGLRLTIP